MSIPNDAAQINEDDFVSRARKAMLADNDTLALSLARQVLKQNNENVGALVIFGQLSDNEEKAIRALERAIALDPENSEAKMALRQRRKNAASTPAPSSKAKNDDGDVVAQLMRQNQELMMRMQQPAAAPVINVVTQNTNTNTNTNTNINSGGAYNQTAHIIGFIAAIFGFYGVAHMFNGKLLSGLAWLLIGGPLFLGIMWTVAAVTIIGLPIAAILHFVAAWQHAKSGATTYLVVAV